MEDQVLGGRYELQRRIGSGGMAQVYLGYDRVLGREVAIKILRPEWAADPAFVERFKREAQAAARLNHPNIVRIYDWGPSGETYFIVMEYIAGPTLKDLVQRRGALPEDEALAIGEQIAGALEAAHRNGVIHRDIKPHNILLDDEGTVKVVDFGIARAAGLAQLTTTNAVSGTVQYASPEQIRRHDVDLRTDLYSLGIVLYELLTGHVPFSGDSPINVAMQHLQAEPDPPGHQRPDLAPATQAAVIKALAKDPDRRFQTAAEMRAELGDARRRLSTPQPTETDTPTVVVRPARRTLRERQVHAAPTAPLPSSSPPRRFQAWIMAVPLAFVLLAAGALAYESRGGHRVAAPPPATATRAAHRVQPHTPSRVAVTTRPTATPTAAPTWAPVPSATSPPVPVPTSPLAAPAAPAVVSHPAATATPTAAPSGGAASPEQAVYDFYAFVTAHQFAQAASLWSSNMLAHWTVEDAIDHRFANTQSITVERARLQSDDEVDGRASVEVWLQEVSGSPPVTSHLHGIWYLIRTPSGRWLLDDVAFQTA